MGRFGKNQEPNKVTERMSGVIVQLKKRRKKKKKLFLFYSGEAVWRVSPEGWWSTWRHLHGEQAQAAAHCNEISACIRM